MVKSPTALIVAGLALSLPICMGGCPRPEDALEPNDTPETATRLIEGMPVEPRTVQDNPDCFVIAAGPAQTLVFTFETLGEEDCNSFKVTGPDGATFYEDDNNYCGRIGDIPVVQPGGQLDLVGEDGYVLTIHAESAGDYVLTVHERGQADNIFDYSWRYRLTATTK